MSSSSSTNPYKLSHHSWCHVSSWWHTYLSTISLHLLSNAFKVAWTAPSADNCLINATGIYTYNEGYYCVIYLCFTGTDAKINGKPRFQDESFKQHKACWRAYGNAKENFFKFSYPWIWKQFWKSWSSKAEAHSPSHSFHVLIHYSNPLTNSFGLSRSAKPYIRTRLTLLSAPYVFITSSPLNMNESSINAILSLLSWCPWWQSKGDDPSGTSVQHDDMSGDLVGQWLVPLMFASEGHTVQHQRNCMTSQMPPFCCIGQFLVALSLKEKQYKTSMQVLHTCRCHYGDSWRGGHGWYTPASCDHDLTVHAQQLMFQQVAPPSPPMSKVLEETSSLHLVQYLNRLSSSSPSKWILTSWHTTIALPLYLVHRAVLGLKVTS